MKLLTPRSQADLDHWYEMAINDPLVSPYLSTTVFWEIPKIEGGSWSSLHYLDGGTYLSMSFARHDCCADVAIRTLDPLVHVVHSGRAIKFAMEIMRKESILRVNTTVHFTNKISLSLNEKIFGTPWGVEPHGAWDREKMEWVDAVHFGKLLT